MENKYIFLKKKDELVVLHSVYKIFSNIILIIVRGIKNKRNRHNMMH